MYVGISLNLFLSTTLSSKFYIANKKLKNKYITERKFKNAVLHILKHMAMCITHRDGIIHKHNRAQFLLDLKTQ